MNAIGASAVTRCEDGAPRVRNGRTNRDQEGDPPSSGGVKEGVVVVGGIEQDDDEAIFPAGHTEPERFSQALAYHRSLLFDYTRRWDMNNRRSRATRSNDDDNERRQDDDGGSHSSNSDVSNILPSSTAWPRHVPDARDVPALEFDLTFCLKSLRRRESGARPPRHPHLPQISNTETAAAFFSSSPSRICEDVQFRLASFYLRQAGRRDQQIRGCEMARALAEHGHPDGMCLYGT
jgi:hypothetical protein